LRVDCIIGDKIERLFLQMIELLHFFLSKRPPTL
jgi:hypothetical protein